MNKFYYIIIILTIFSWASCTDDDTGDDVPNTIQGSFEADVSGTWLPSYHYVADSIVSAYFAPTQDTLIIVAMDKEFKSFLFMFTGFIEPGTQSINYNPATQNLTFAYNELMATPSVLYLNTEEPDLVAINIEEWNVDAKSIKGSFYFNAFGLVEVEEDVLMSTQNGTFEIQYVDSRENLEQLPTVTVPNPLVDVHSEVEYTFLTTSGVSYEGTYDTLFRTGLILPTDDGLRFSFIFTLPDGSDVAVACPAAEGNYIVVENDEDGIIAEAIVFAPGTTFEAKSGFINIESIDYSLKIVKGSFNLSGSNNAEEPNEVLFQCAGTYSVGYI